MPEVWTFVSYLTLSMVSQTLPEAARSQLSPSCPLRICGPRLGGHHRHKKARPWKQLEPKRTVIVETIVETITVYHSLTVCQCILPRLFIYFYGLASSSNNHRVTPLLELGNTLDAPTVNACIALELTIFVRSYWRCSFGSEATASSCKYDKQDCPTNRNPPYYIAFLCQSSAYVMFLS